MNENIETCSNEVERTLSDSTESEISNSETDSEVVFREKCKILNINIEEIK